MKPSKHLPVLPRPQIDTSDCHRHAQACFRAAEGSPNHHQQWYEIGLMWLRLAIDCESRASLEPAPVYFETAATHHRPACQSGSSQTVA